MPATAVRSPSATWPSCVSPAAVTEAVHVHDRVGADGGDRFVGDDHADQVERVGGVDGDSLLGAGRFADPRQVLDGGGQGVLLAAEAAHEATAAHQAAIFEP